MENLPFNNGISLTQLHATVERFSIRIVSALESQLSKEKDNPFSTQVAFKPYVSELKGREAFCNLVLSQGDPLKCTATNNIQFKN